MLGQRHLLFTLMQLLMHLPHLNWLLVLILKYYRDTNSPSPVTSAIAAKGLGRVVLSLLTFGTNTSPLIYISASSPMHSSLSDPSK